MLNRRSLGSERGKRRVLKLTEAAIVGVGDERDTLGPKNAVSAVGKTAVQNLFNMRNQKAGPDERVVEAGLNQHIVFVAITVLYLPVERIVSRKHKSTGIAKRTWFCRNRHALSCEPCPFEPANRLTVNDFSFCQPSFIEKTTPRSPASVIWSI